MVKSPLKDVFPLAFLLVGLFFSIQRLSSAISCYAFNLHIYILTFYQWLVTTDN
jgi:uncharacterized membrane protein